MGNLKYRASRGVHSAARRPAARKRRNQGNWEIRKVRKLKNDPELKIWAICGAEAPLEAAGDIQYGDSRAIRVASRPQARNWKIKNEN